jgi:hypothetical protein
VTVGVMADGVVDAADEEGIEVPEPPPSETRTYR